MYKLCKTEQSAMRQQKLEQGLLEVMGNCHYDEITICDLCRQMGIPRKSFYRYFSGKDGALHALIDHTLMRNEMKGFDYNSGKMTSIQKELEHFFRFWMEQKQLLDALARSGLSGVLIERAIEYAVAENRPQYLNVDSSSVSTQEYMVMFAICGLMTMMVRWHHGGYTTTVEQMAEVAAWMLTKPLLDGV